MKSRLVFAAAALTVAVPAAAETVVITAAQMLDVEKGVLVPRPVITVTDGRITALGGAAPAGAKRIDLGDVTLVPGLIDMHVHLDSTPIYGGYNGLQFTDSFWGVQGVGNAGAMLRAGFTTVRNVGSENYNDVAYKQAIDEGLMVGPRIVPAAYALGATGGHCDSTFFPPSFNQRGKAVGDTPDELRTRVREQRKYGAEVIKVCASGGVFSRNTEPGQQQLSEGELRAIADEAHQWGLKTAAHAHGAAGIKAAIRAGIDTIEHASLIDDEGIRLAKEKGTYLSMDIYNTEYTQAEGKKNGVLEDNLRKDREIAQIQRDNFRKANAAGVKMVFGTDAGVMPHKDAGKQFGIMVRFGMTPLQAIRAATLTAADALGRNRDVGAIAVGRFGDIVAVAGNPLEDVTVLERPAAVIKGGARVD
ncbi:Xaa-Pro dipeptidase [Sphingomonas sp. Ag1]|uniref:Xaa-Pro dipeptidase n=1 Tax=Sphingomonas sp. Ag1 TaxID=1642949 RepID=UPI0006221E1A|nr:amidohydrolase family protein [Sphingomonas sp. Ag1]KKI19880.1 Xaa-Pro dipeptidase [Sphingomonas sp. Ag1]